MPPSPLSEPSPAGDRRDESREPLSPEQVAALAGAGERVTHQAGEAIFRRGEQGAAMYLIEAGAVALEFEGVKAGKRLAKGQLFGELALVRGEHLRTATAVAATDCRLSRLDQAAFDVLERRHPALLTLLLRRSCAYLVESEQELIRDLTHRNRQLERTVEFLRRTQRERDTQELLAQTDELTGLYNRRCLNAQIDSFLERPERSEAGLALILVDLDHFKEINDRHGHAVGDVVLQRFSRLLQGAVRSSDLPCRIGGDEFAVLLPGLIEVEARERALRLLHAFGCFEAEAEGGPPAVTASLGGTLHRHGEDWLALLERADRNLYTAKRLGRRRLVWDDDEVLGVVGPRPA